MFFNNKDLQNISPKFALTLNNCYIYAMFFGISRISLFLLAGLALFLPGRQVFGGEGVTVEDILRFEEISASPDVMKLVIFPPEAKVYDAPFGKTKGVIKRGRIIYLLESEGEWIKFTTREYPQG